MQKLPVITIAAGASIEAATEENPERAIGDAFGITILTKHDEEVVVYNFPVGVPAVANAVPVAVVARYKSTNGHVFVRLPSGSLKFMFRGTGHNVGVLAPVAKATASPT